MADGPFVKNDVDLLLDDVAKHLEESCQWGLEVTPPPLFNRLWHAVLSLTRATRAMREEAAGRPDGTEELEKRIRNALEWLKPFVDHPEYEPMPRVKKAIRILEGEV